MKVAAAALIPVILGGCGAQYRVEIWNDTGVPVEMAVVERFPDGTPAGGRPRATVAPGGWFDYELRRGRHWPNRFVEVWKPQEPAGALDIDLSGRQVLHGRIFESDRDLKFEALSAAAAALRRPPTNATANRPGM